MKLWPLWNLTPLGDNWGYRERIVEIIVQPLFLPLRIIIAVGSYCKAILERIVQ